MQRLIGVFFFTYSCVVITYAQILYQCNYDTYVGTFGGCLAGEASHLMVVADKIGTAGIQAPTTPLSDVTSSLKPTTNGERCIIPYKVGNYTWDMYFCNNGYCPTSRNPNTTCTSGRFGRYILAVAGAQLISFTLNTDSGGTNGTNQQCLTYYYYLPNIPGIQQNIKVRKQEPGGTSEQIDSVINSPYNGWIKREVSFSTIKPGYKINFDFQKTQGLDPATIAIDEISIHQGSCSTEPVTETTTTTTRTTISVSETSTVPSTISTAIEPTTAGTTTVTMVPTTTTTTLATDTSSSASTTTPATTTTMTTTASPTTTTTTTAITSTSTEIPTTTIPTTSTAIENTSTEKLTTMKTTIQSITTASTTAKPATGTTTLTTTLSTSERIGGNEEDSPSNKTLIIALATAIPLGLIAIVGIGVWIKRSVASGVLSGISHPFSDIAHQDGSNVIELDEYDQEHTF